ncbi:MAG: hypothetical protein FWC50_02775 [Planctomycetaceae bacterium]|nr:hypothetical protein [Planctomycetaceae bacterium]
MSLSWNEIKARAVNFSKEWGDEQRENAEAQTFWNDFFDVFGVRRRTVATFEEKVRDIQGRFGFIDLFWRGKLLAEHKSCGKPLDKAASQAFEYIQCLKDEGRDDEIPRYVIVSDFAEIVLYDLEPEEDDPPVLAFPTGELYKHVLAFAFIPGYKVHRPHKEDSANLKAAELMGRVHDALAASGYSGHILERFLVRILFCLFAEDTGIFEPNAFTIFLEQNTKEDGSDLGPMLAQFFETLDTPREKRQTPLEEIVATLPFVNGGLFEETLRSPACNRAIRDAILVATRFDWSRISPAVFGSLFQSVMDQDARRMCGAHYTTEDNIMKVLRPLFLDELRAEFAKVKANKSKLREFHQKLALLTFFDPACGCGNFLVLAYRELRLLEMDVLQAIYRKDTFDLAHLVQVDVDQFYGIEIIEFPVRIAETALWLTDHQMNVRATERFGKYFVRLPLQKSAKIVHDNALRIDWNAVLPKNKCSYILGNPPFVGKQFQTPEQKDDMALVLQDMKKVGILDYVVCWYFKAAEYIQNTLIQVGFVSTNSIAQGEQVGVLWSELFQRGIKINFGYTTFVWSNEAKGKAHVHCVIIGFSVCDKLEKRIFAEQEGKMTARSVQKINPYLIEGNDIALSSRSKPICPVPEIVFGSMPNDGGHLLFTNDEKKEFLRLEPGAKKWFRPFLGAEEFINGISRWCLWLVDIPPSELRALPEVMRRIELVKRHRLQSKRETTRKLAKTPSIFGEIRQPKGAYILIPGVSSERRPYIPIGFIKNQTVASNATLIFPHATLFHFGILTSAMHNDWMRRVCGRLESRYRYSAQVVYNNFPWPLDVSEIKKNKVVEKAQKVLDVRATYETSTLADLYDPLSMPRALNKAHRELDIAVDRCYRSKPFGSDQERLEFLFGLYEKLTDKLKFC